MKKLLLILAIFILWPSASHKAYAAFTYYSPVTVNAAQVPSTQTDFPVLVSYTDNRLKTTGGHVLNSNGYDIRPYADSALTSALTYELESYDSSAGTVVMWVKVSSLAVGSVIYLAYGDAALNTNGSSNSTWSNGFQAVYHLPNGSSLSPNDSTSNANTLTNHSATASTGKVDGGADFVVTNSAYLNRTSNTGLNITGDLTFSAWLKPRTGDTSLFMYPFQKGKDGSGNLDYGIGTDGGPSNWRVVIRSTTGYVDLATGITYDTWQLIHGVFDSATHTGYGYKNASQYGSASGGISSSITNSSSDIWIGALDVNFLIYYGGGVDELRISNVIRSADWITTEYNNQNAPSTFATLGTESPVSAGTVLPRLRLFSGRLTLTSGRLTIR